uniref:dnaJ homolog subfamily C member 10 n=1 Tax=Myxine glutinosa TaxID=7769 RepID=UPI00358F9C18
MASLLRGLTLPSDKGLFTYLALLLLLLAVGLCSDDFYQLIGVSRDASTRDIRKAFKKLALTMHPDKNQDDPSAHEKFLKISRAYEILKDEDLRKKYDKYGEEGLDESGQQQRRYETWTYYRYDFGIYDDDPEIITLDKGNFDAAVSSGELWFVNFYSPGCSHCHNLAPTWREFAKEMDGVIRIGAVNCGDNTRMCQLKGIRSYPNLYMFRAGMDPVKFSGKRTKEDIIKFALSYVRSQVVELWAGNLESSFQQAASVGMASLITFCAVDADCLSQHTRQKLAGMLEGLVDIAWIDCSTQAQTCLKLGAGGGITILYHPGYNPFNDSALQDSEPLVHVLRSLDAREIYNEVIQTLPDMETLQSAHLEESLLQSPWLIFFIHGENANPTNNEFKKLSILLKSHNIRVGKYNCVSDVRVCRKLYVQQPCVAMFKGEGLNAYEIHHGQNNLYEILGFAKDSVGSSVVTLGPDTFPRQEKEPWLVDFFAPWCPPCRALLPELRKASKQLTGQLRFGTVDCTIHMDICNLHNIEAYPTTLVFNQSSVHVYDGQHSAQYILEFVQDLVAPTVVTLEPGSFEALVHRRRPGDIWAVDFYAPWCQPCRELMPEWKRMARMLSGFVHVGSVDCQKYNRFCHGQGIHSFPEIRIFPDSTSHGANRFHLYNGWLRNADSLKTWALSFLPAGAENLTPATFTQAMQTGTEHWLIDYYAPWCGPCQAFSPEFAMVAQLLKGKVRAGKVNCQQFSHLCQTNGIRAYPTLKLYPYKQGQQRSQVGEVISITEAKVIADTVEKRLQASWTSGQKDEL